ncbi:MAG: metallophosphoesterase, partial [Gammaproteobacteria bacterium]|nr:metallophosphoesterase [Gammaproteobacteria bacterium]
MRSVWSRAWVCCCLGLLAVSTIARAETYRYAGVERLVAVGDAHGAYDRFSRLLLETGIVDENLQWTGGKTHFVDLGDFLDRGPGSRKIMDLLMRLQTQAEKSGGRVHVLLGNHELMNLTGDL